MNSTIKTESFTLFCSSNFPLHTRILKTPTRNWQKYLACKWFCTYFQSNENKPKKWPIIVIFVTLSKSLIWSKHWTFRKQHWPLRSIYCITIWSSKIQISSSWISTQPLETKRFKVFFRVETELCSLVHSFIEILRSYRLKDNLFFPP